MALDTLSSMDLWMNFPIHVLISIQCEAPKIAKLVPITPITMVYGTYNYSYWGESKPTNITGGLTLY